MGLDMYLTGSQYVSPYDFNKEDKEFSDAISATLGRFQENKFPVVGIDYRLMYWRKANHIHKWFVDNVQDGKDDCGRYYVDDTSLRELKTRCEEALQYEKANSEKALEILPTQKGFFFGGTEPDEYYFQDIKDTLEAINKIIKAGLSLDIYYESSW